MPSEAACSSSVPAATKAAGAARRTARGALYCYLAGERVVVLHAFVKKTPETPARHLQTARRRMKEVRDG